MNENQYQAMAILLLRFGEDMGNGKIKISVEQPIKNQQHKGNVEEINSTLEQFLGLKAGCLSNDNPFIAEVRGEGGSKAPNSAIKETHLLFDKESLGKIADKKLKAVQAMPGIIIDSYRRCLPIGEQRRLA